MSKTQNEVLHNQSPPVLSEGLDDEIRMELGIASEEVSSLTLDTQVQADRLLKLIGKMESAIVELEDEAYNAEQFYKTEIAKRKDRIGQISFYLESYLMTSEKKTIKLPNGCLSIRKWSKVGWPDNDVLLAFSKVNNISVRVKPEEQAPDKRELLKYIKKTGEVPEGYVESDTQTFSYQIWEEVKDES